ncbi:MAG TPA: hypothetical protein V6C63_06285 [Allocoleopsis sp.]
MRTHQALHKKATTQKSNTPIPNSLESRPFAVQPKAGDSERSQEPKGLYMRIWYQLRTHSISLQWLQL